MLQISDFDYLLQHRLIAKLISTRNNFLLYGIDYYSDVEISCNANNIFKMQTLKNVVFMATIIIYYSQAPHNAVLITRNPYNARINCF